MIDYEFNPGVINVLIDFVLKTKNNKLARDFVLTIADQWKRENIQTVEEAMEISKRENKKSPVKRTKKIVEEKPKWYGKEFEEDKATDEDIKALEDKINNALRR